MKQEEVAIGDKVLIEQCWEDEQGNYHDEYAEVINITKHGTLILNWLDVPKEVHDYLDSCSFEAKDVSYVID